MIVKDLCVGRKYQTAAGEEKTQWIRIGAIHEAKSGKQYMTLDSHISVAGLPRAVDGDDRVYVQMFDPKPRESFGSKPAAKGGSGFEDMSDDIPPF